MAGLLAGIRKGLVQSWFHFTLNTEILFIEETFQDLHYTREIKILVI